MFYTLLVANVLMAVGFVLKFQNLPPQIPLFYSRPWGEYQITKWWLIFILPILMNALYVSNLFICKKLFPQDEFAQKIFKYFNLFLIVSFTLIFLRIIFLVS